MALLNGLHFLWNHNVIPQKMKAVQNFLEKRNRIVIRCG
ncbi:hypothetical protein B1R32_103115 [Abditibacterium utsteinense]|uniref:Uncharacterized protein n=1 Tax=Abditibacterium utsteinense TaxID=1960156 RepID=A0A2S8SVN8_9BACT|nr:hypothetical protein B1R32_103115 [Abditibacterium utsteinense]